MPVYIQLLKWTDQGRQNVDSLPDRADAVAKQVAELGVKIIGHYATMGRYDQIVVSEAPDDETVAKVAVMVAGRGNVISETLRGFTMEELRDIM